MRNTFSFVNFPAIFSEDEGVLDPVNVTVDPPAS